jgi:hypothetical protein
VLHFIDRGQPSSPEGEGACIIRLSSASFTINKAPTVANQEDLLQDLLSRWQDLRRQGKELTPAELCADCPELAPELERQVAALHRMDRLAVAVGEKDTPGTPSTRPDDREAPLPPAPTHPEPARPAPGLPGR